MTHPHPGRLQTLPSALARQSRFERLGAPRVPALLAHPNWERPAPTLIWLHGRTADKTLDNGRYLRLLRAAGSGIASCALDLPGHGERPQPALQTPERIHEAIAQAINEIDHVVEALSAPEWRGVFDLDHLALGGMSAGGIVSLRRLCDPHPFRCAAVESTAGDLTAWYRGSSEEGQARPDPSVIAHIDPMLHTASWRPIPLLALHSEADRVAPLECLTPLLDRLRSQYVQQNARPEQIVLKTWPSTGAPDEHSGFGRVAADAKSLLVTFLEGHLGLSPTSG